MTQEEFLTLARKKHGDTYDYSRLKYTTSYEKVEIGCSKHGWFEQIATHHAHITGCPRCGHERSSLLRSKSFGDFVMNAKSVHGDNYHYDNTYYVSNSVKMKIYCNTCGGYFQQTPKSHCRGRGCSICSSNSKSRKLKSNTGDFVRKALLIHGDKYDYSIAEYVDSKTKINLICNTCVNTFTITPNKHLLGRGCPHCAKCGFKVQKPAEFYILTCKNITKVGITNDKAKSRASMVSKSFGETFEVYKTYKFESGNACLDLEINILKYLKSMYISPHERFHGYSECFYDVDVISLVQEVEKIYENQKTT